MAALDDVSPGRGERIELAVQREMARRRRLLRLYLLLLLIPLGVAAWFLAAGRSDRAAVEQAVESSVGPRLAELKQLGEALPAVQNAAREVQAQKARVSALAQGQETLQQQVTSVASDVKSLEPRVRALQVQPPPDVTLQREVGARLDELAKNVKELRQGQDSLALQQRSITTDFEKLRLEKQPPTGLSTFDLQRLDNRLRALEQENQSLRSEMGRLRTVRPPG